MTARLERQLRTIRNNIFDLPGKKGEKAMRIIDKIKAELEPVWYQRGVDFRSESMLRMWYSIVGNKPTHTNMKNSQLTESLKKALDEVEDLKARLKVSQDAATIAMRETEILRKKVEIQGRSVDFVAKLYRQLQDSPKSFLTRMGKILSSWKKLRNLVNL